MPRTARHTPGGYAYHVLNRGVGRMQLFDDEGDYLAFEKVLVEGLEKYPGVRLCSFCVMPNHWHLVVWPKLTPHPLERLTVRRRNQISYQYNK